MSDRPTHRDGGDERGEGADRRGPRDDGDPLGGGRDRELDATLAALGHATRRRALGVLATVDGPLAVADLARDLARGAEPGTDDEGTGDRQPGSAANGSANARTLRLELRHWHLPRLAEAGVVDLDRERGTVALAADAERCRAWLATAEGNASVPARRTSET